MVFLALFCICLAEELIKLEPVSAQPTINCSAVSGGGENGPCNSLPGCYWNVSVSACVVDDCLSFSATGQAQLPSGGDFERCECPEPKDGGNFSWSHPADSCGDATRVAKDTYCHHKLADRLTRCGYLYLYNSSVPAPYCKTEPAMANVAEGSNVNISKPVTGCDVDDYGQLVNLCSCLGAWDSCDSVPFCYLVATTCVKDTCVNLADPAVTGDCPNSCSPVEVYFPTVNATGGIIGNSLKNICVSTGLNESPNKCYYLVHLTINSTSSYCPTTYNANKDQCSAITECSLVENAGLYDNYFGTKYFCTDESHGPPGSGNLIKVPSILALLLIVASFIF